MRIDSMRITVLVDYFEDGKEVDHGAAKWDIEMENPGEIESPAADAAFAAMQAICGDILRFQNGGKDATA